MHEITRLKIADKRGMRTAVEIDGEPWREIDTEVVLKAGLSAGMPMDDAALDALALDDETVRARRAAARLLQTRPRAVSELRALLGRREFSPQAVDRVVAHFSETGDLDDARFARVFARHEFKMRATGPLKVRHKLRKLGVGEDLIDHALAEEPEASPQAQRRAARRFVERRIERLKGDCEARRRKLLGAMRRAGFDADVAWEMVRELDE